MPSPRSGRCVRRLCVALALLTAAAVAPAAGLAAPAVPGASDPSFGRRGFVSMDRVPGAPAGALWRFTSMRLLRDDTLQLSTSGCGVSCPGRRLFRLTPSGRIGVEVRQEGSVSGAEIHGLGVNGIIDRPDGGSLVRTELAQLGVVAPGGALVRQASPPVSFAPVAIAPDGAVVGVARRFSDGSEPSGSTPDLARLTPGLSLDTAFGDGGLVALPPALARAGPVSATSAAIRVSGANEDALLLGRYTARGALVRLGRIAVTDLRTPGGVSATQLVVRNGRALAVGQVPRLIGSTEATQSVVVAFRPDGRVDRRFGTRGLLRIAEGDARIALQRDGRLVVASTASGAKRDRLVLRRFSARGRPDPTFRTRRIKTRPRLNGAIGVAIDRRGRIAVASGTWTPPLSFGVLIARFLPGPTRRA